MVERLQAPALSSLGHGGSMWFMPGAALNAPSTANSLRPNKCWTTTTDHLFTVTDSQVLIINNSHHLYIIDSARINTRTKN